MQITKLEPVKFDPGQWYVDKDGHLRCFPSPSIVMTREELKKHYPDALEVKDAVE